MIDDTMSMEELEKTKAIMQVLYRRICTVEGLKPENHESLAYRIAEIMGAAKNLYTVMLPALMESETNEASWEKLVEMRMHFLHAQDLISEFEELFLSSIDAEEEQECTDPGHHHDN